MPQNKHITLCSEAVTWAQNCVTWPDPKTLYAVNQFIKNCKNHGNWDLMDRFWLLGTGTQDNSSVSLINPTSTRLTQYGAITWTQYVGCQADGSTGHIDTGYNFLSDAVEVQPENFSAGVWVVQPNTAGSGIDMGTCCGALCIASHFGSYNCLVEMNDANVAGYNATPTGLLNGTRTNSTINNVWVNGANVQTNTTAGSATWYGASSNVNIFQYAGVPYYSNAQLFLAYIGSGNMDQVAFYNDCQMLYNRLNG